jgi:hypothetical protein
MMKLLAIVISEDGDAGEGAGGGCLTNEQCKTIQNYHNKFPLYNEYLLIKFLKRSCSTKVVRNQA